MVSNSGRHNAAAMAQYYPYPQQYYAGAQYPQQPYQQEHSVCAADCCAVLLILHSLS